jgi:hypothetical protein
VTWIPSFLGFARDLAMVANKLRSALSLSKRGIRANRGYLCDMRRVRILKPLGLTSMFEKDTSVTLLGTLRARTVFY